MKRSRQYRWVIAGMFLFALIIVTTIMADRILLSLGIAKPEERDSTFNSADSLNHNTFSWQAPDTSELYKDPAGELILYGRSLVSNTSNYFGPKGKLIQISNGMNCQNCHLQAGTKYFGNNFSAVFSTYPRFRERSGTVENIYKRINDCFERSLNAKHGLDTNSREMKAIIAYIEWLGTGVPKDVIPNGAGLMNLAFPDRPADPGKGKIIYQNSCSRCHGKNGEGLINPDSMLYVYPPLWGPNSYTTAAGLFRISRFAGFVKHNMPFDSPGNAALLTDEEAWDVAAFVNFQPRPMKKFKQDWPNISGKPIDHPFGPYADSFSERQHKFGPFAPIKEFYAQRVKN